ncbi:MAG: hypothetical protein HY738_13715, partial [Bacteroidia bacterium]|nr:hypothetical protein [Bacteroidia bacterium]
MKKISFTIALLVLAGGMVFCQPVTTNTQPVATTLNNSPIGRISKQTKQWQQGGIFDGLVPENELRELRTEYSKKVRIAPDKVNVIIGGPFHYKDEHGAWQDIDLTIKQSNIPVYKYVNDENRFVSRFGGNAADGVEMTYKNRSISFGINPAVSSTNWVPASSQNTNVVANENIISYKNLYNDVDLEYEITTEKISHRLCFANSNVFSGLLSQQFVNVDEEIQLPTNAVLMDSLGIISTNRATKGNIFVVVNNDTVFTIIAS